MAVSPARAAAFDILLRVERESSYAAELLHSPAYQELSSADHGLATELVMGVLRWRSRLDDEIAKASSQRLNKLDLEVLIALRLGLYQFRWLTRIPHHAALHESVELVKRARKASAGPFVNAVLRKLSGNVPATQIPPPDIASAHDLASTYAHPAWLVERWIDQYGISAAHKICQHNQSIPRTSIRLRSPESESELAAAGITLGPGKFLRSAREVLSGDITSTEAFRAGQIVIQDEASQLVAALVGSAPQILDCCAAPGGKTLAVADRNQSSRITAVEVHRHRARTMQKLLRAAGSIHIDTVVADARNLPVTNLFSRVLADVPCSGTGTLARNPEIKWRLKLEDLAALQERQVAILRSAMAHVSPGGRLIYSTCSLEAEENEQVVCQALLENESFRKVDCRFELERLETEGELTWPELTSLTRDGYLRTMPKIHPCDGFFAAILERK